MTKVTIAGCGIVGATIAYELSKCNLDVTVVDAQATPVQPNLSVCPTATGAALGVLMGVISKKEKGNNLRMRLTSIEYYNQTIPELEALTNCKIPFNRHGILMLQFDEVDLPLWNRLVEVRASQGHALEILDLDRLKTNFPQVSIDSVQSAIYSPHDRQVNPVALTHALIAGAKLHGATFQFDTTVTGFQNHTVFTSQGTIETDYFILCAGVGSTAITRALDQLVDIRPVLGQAIQVRLPRPLGTLQPVITGNDVHVVPLENSEYWIGATVEFPDEVGNVLPIDRSQFDAVMQQAIAFCPALGNAQTIRTWHGLRPRPQGRPAPIVEFLPGYDRVLLATGHYRNGVLLAPATAQKVKEMILVKRLSVSSQ